MTWGNLLMGESDPRKADYGTFLGMRVCDLRVWLAASRPTLWSKQGSRYYAVIVSPTPSQTFNVRVAHGRPQNPGGGTTPAAGGIIPHGSTEDLGGGVPEAWWVSGMQSDCGISSADLLANRFAWVVPETWLLCTIRYLWEQEWARRYQTEYPYGGPEHIEWCPRRPLPLTRDTAGDMTPKPEVSDGRVPGTKDGDGGNIVNF